MARPFVKAVHDSAAREKLWEDNYDSSQAGKCLENQTWLDYHDYSWLFNYYCSHVLITSFPCGELHVDLLRSSRSFLGLSGQNRKSPFQGQLQSCWTPEKSVTTNDDHMDGLATCGCTKTMSHDDTWCVLSVEFCTPQHLVSIVQHAERLNVQKDLNNYKRALSFQSKGKD